MGRARFPSAFVAAISAHGAIVLALALAPKERAGEHPERRLPQELVFVDPEPLPPSPSPGSEPSPEALPPPSPLATRSPLPARPAGERAEPAAAGAPAAVDVVTQPAGSSQSWSFSSRAPVDLGVGGYWKSVALAGSADPRAPSEPPPASTAPDRRLLETLNARDLGLGLARGGPLVAAAHEAASLAIAPDTGSATFDVESDASGRVMAANLVASNGEAPAWTDVARELVSLMASKRLHLRPGARGLRTRLRITAERTLPSGTQTSSSPGAVPDDVPGADPVCEGQGSERKCVAGMPVGVTRSFGDVANIGAKATRIVHALILGEQTL